MQRAGFTILAISVLAGCHASVSTSTPPPTPAPNELTTRSEAETIRGFGRELRDARDKLAEADTLKRLDRYMRDRGLTFTVKRFGQANEAIGNRGLQGSGPWQCRVEVFHGQQPIQAITFIPVDERNLALIGQ